MSHAQSTENSENQTNVNDTSSESVSHNEVDERKGVDDISLPRHPSLIIKPNTPKGRGVFTTTTLSSGVVIETCPILLFPPSDLSALATTLADHYTYNWPFRDASTGRTIACQAISLGLGSIFNHARGRGLNVGWRRDLEREVIVYATLREVEAGEELCIRYGSGERLWFTDVDGDDSQDGSGMVEESEEQATAGMMGIEVDE